MQETQEIDASFWEGFDAAIALITNLLDNYESNELAKMSCWELIEQIKEDVIEEQELYKTDG